MKTHISLLTCLLFFTTVFATSDEFGSVFYKMGDDTVIFQVRQIRSIDVNNDQALSRYIKKFKLQQTVPVIEYQTVTPKKGYRLLFFWKNFTGKRWGFVVAYRTGTNIWKIRMNGEKVWTKIELYENESFKWFTGGKSLGVSVEIEESNSLRYLYTGDIDY